MIFGGIVSGIIMKPEFNKIRQVDEEVEHNIQVETYGFLGLLFFFWVGLHTDLRDMVEEPVLVILLFFAAFFGKLLGTFIMVPMKKLTVREGWLIGIGINARLTTEIIVIQLLFHAKVIDVHLYTALLASSSVSSILVPLIFTILVSKLGDQFKKLPFFQKK
jgi:P-type Ca2+ transporter type 2C